MSGLLVRADRLELDAFVSVWSAASWASAIHVFPDMVPAETTYLMENVISRVNFIVKVKTECEI